MELLRIKLLTNLITSPNSDINIFMWHQRCWQLKRGRLHKAFIFMFIISGVGHLTFVVLRCKQSDTRIFSNNSTIQYNDYKCKPHKQLCNQYHCKRFRIIRQNITYWYEVVQAWTCSYCHNVWDVTMRVTEPQPGQFERWDVVVINHPVLPVPGQSGRVLSGHRKGSGMGGTIVYLWCENNLFIDGIYFKSLQLPKLANVS